MGKQYKVTLGDEMDARLRELAEKSGIAAATWLAVWAVDRLTGGSPESLIGALRSLTGSLEGPGHERSRIEGPSQGLEGPSGVPAPPLSRTSGTLRARSLSLSDSSLLPPPDLSAPSSADPLPPVDVPALAVEVSKIIRAGRGKARGPQVPPASLERHLLAAVMGRPPHHERYTAESLLEVARHFTREWVGTQWGKGLNPERLYGKELGVNVGQLDADYTSRVGEADNPPPPPPVASTIVPGWDDERQCWIRADGSLDYDTDPPTRGEDTARVVEEARKRLRYGPGGGE